MKAIFMKVKTWVLIASFKGASTEESLLEYSMQPVTLPSSVLQKQLKKRLNSMLGPSGFTWMEVVPTCGLTNYPPVLMYQVTTAAMAYMTSAQPNAGNVSNIYLRGWLQQRACIMSCNHRTRYTSILPMHRKGQLWDSAMKRHMLTCQISGRTSIQQKQNPIYARCSTRSGTQTQRTLTCSTTRYTGWIISLMLSEE